MRFISTRYHGMMDYLAGIALIAAPFLFGFADGGAAMWVPIMIGVGMLGVSLFTDYELGIIRRIPMPVHLGTDALVGALLAASPWLFQFADQVWVPHVVLGIAEIMAAVTTETRPRLHHAGVARNLPV
jgi:hypothetical protein